jgi:hypothetical protein
MLIFLRGTAVAARAELGRRLTPCAVLVLAVGCGSSQATKSAARPSGHTPAGPVDRYLPFRAGTVLAYESADENTGQRGVVMLRVSRPRPDRVELNDGGQVQRLDVDSTGVSHAAGGFLLKTPLTAGATFPGRFGKVTITKTDVSVQVPAGSFTGCLETEEAAPGGQGKATTVFCPDVGIVSLDVESLTDGEYGRVRLVLRSYGAAVDIEALAGEE